MKTLNRYGILGFVLISSLMLSPLLSGTAFAEKGKLFATADAPHENTQPKFQTLLWDQAAEDRRIQQAGEDHVALLSVQHSIAYDTSVGWSEDEKDLLNRVLTRVARSKASQAKKFIPLIHPNALPLKNDIAPGVLPVQAPSQLDALDRARIVLVEAIHDEKKRLVHMEAPMIETMQKFSEASKQAVRDSIHELRKAEELVAEYASILRKEDPTGAEVIDGEPSLKDIRIEDIPTIITQLHGHSGPALGRALKTSERLEKWERHFSGGDHPAARLVNPGKVNPKVSTQTQID